MIAHLGLSVAVFLVGFFAGADAGKCFEVSSVDSTCTSYYCTGGRRFNFFADDTELIFDGTDALKYSSSYSFYPTVDHYRNGALINESVKLFMYNNSEYGPTVGDSYGSLYNGLYPPGRFETGDFLCLFPGVMMTPIPENSTGVGSSACTGTVSGSSSMTVSGLEECQQKCQLDPDCNTINYCNDATLCSSYSGQLPYCTFRKCTGDDYKVSTLYGKFDIYTKVNESCTDMVQNQMEEGVDCGGPNCAEIACPTCNDKVKNQDEEDIDCGGSTCDACPTCTDGIKNQDEDDIDCGGVCEACPPTCTDGIKNQDEDDIDCGGACDACPCKNKLTRQQCNGKFKNGKCNRPWVQKRCKATCGHYSKCCGNKMGDQRCERLKPYCNANWIVPEWIAKKVGNRCKKTCGKCPN